MFGLISMIKFQESLNLEDVRKEDDKSKYLGFVLYLKNQFRLLSLIRIMG